MALSVCTVEGIIATTARAQVPVVLAVLEAAFERSRPLPCPHDLHPSGPVGMGHKRTPPPVGVLSEADLWRACSEADVMACGVAFVADRVLEVEQVDGALWRQRRGGFRPGSHNRAGLENEEVQRWGRGVPPSRHPSQRASEAVGGSEPADLVISIVFVEAGTEGFDFGVGFLLFDGGFSIIYEGRKNGIGDGLTGGVGDGEDGVKAAFAVVGDGPVAVGGCELRGHRRFSGLG